MISPKKTLRVTLAASAATALMLVATPGVAFAQEVGGEAAPAAAAANFTEPADPSTAPEKATLTIHKLTPSDDEVDPARNNGNPIQSTPPSSKPVQGVDFTLYKVENVDLGTNAGWITANKIADAWKALNNQQKRTAVANRQIVVGDVTYTLTQDTPVQTGADGTAVFSEKNRGLYVAAESIKGDVTVDGKQYPKEAVVQSVPFVVALPMTNQDNTEQWLDSVHVYPKNAVTSAEKSVADESAYGAGSVDPSKLVYTILTEIPKTPRAAAAATALDRYKIVDPLDYRLKYITEGNVLKTVDASGVQVGEDLAEGTDYTIISTPVDVPDWASNATPAPATYVTVVFNATGREKLVNAQRQGAVNVQWDLPAEVKDVASKDKDAVNPNTIPNKAVLLPNVPNAGTPDFDPENPLTPVTPNPDNPDGPGTPIPNKPFTPTPDKPTPDIPGVPTNKVESKYGKVVVTKVDPSGKTLAGAEFNLYHCDTDDSKVKSFITDENLVKVNGESKFTTDENGKIVIDGLRLNDWKNDSLTAVNPVKNPTEAYCLKEVKAPAGYELLPNVVRFQLLTTDKNFQKDLEIKNVPANGGFNLPLTGGSGVFPLIALGGLLVVGAAGYAGVAARRNRNEA